MKFQELRGRIATDSLVHSLGLNKAKRIQASTSMSLVSIRSRQTPDVAPLRPVSQDLLAG
jgi:hypothetical protein